ncbi:Arylsulfatase H [Manis pentadactyla]|nr:Arylsulfatase H [Manis pentadactyla]
MLADGMSMRGRYRKWAALAGGTSMRDMCLDSSKEHEQFNQIHRASSQRGKPNLGWKTELKPSCPCYLLCGCEQEAHLCLHILTCQDIYTGLR